MFKKTIGNTNYILASLLGIYYSTRQIRKLIKELKETLKETKTAKNEIHYLLIRVCRGEYGGLLPSDEDFHQLINDYKFAKIIFKFHDTDAVVDHE